jgi:hypothetical protein
MVLGGLLVIAGLLSGRAWEGTLLGLSSDFWCGFLMGVGVAAMSAGIALTVKASR